MDTFLQDLKYAVRKLWGAPAFTLAAVATLAIGVGATTAVFSTVNATLLRPLPYPGPDDPIALRTRYVDARVTTGLVAAVEAARLNQACGSLERAVGLSSTPLDATLLRGSAPPIRATIHFVGEGFFAVFGVPMALGSDFTHDQQTPITNGPGPGQPQGPPPVVVLSHHAWSDLFGSDPRIVGKTIRFAELNATAIGVASQDLDAPHGADFWANARFNPQDVGHGLNAILRVKPGTTLPRLRSEMAVVMTGLARDFPRRGRRARVRVRRRADAADARRVKAAAAAVGAVRFARARLRVDRAAGQRGDARRGTRRPSGPHGSENADERERPLDERRPRHGADDGRDDDPRNRTRADARVRRRLA